MIDEKNAAAAIENEEGVTSALEECLPAKIDRTIGELGGWIGRRIGTIHTHDGIK
jgi:hypothetical protein